MSSTSLPPLPERKSESENVLDGVLDLPALPPRNPKSLASVPLTYTLSDSLSTVTIIRQLETYSSPLMNEASDLFTINSVSQDNVKSKLDTIKLNKSDNDSEEDMDFWCTYIEDYSNQLVRDKRIEELERHILNGIPDNIRSLVYLKTLQVRYKLNKETYNTLLKKANNSQTTKNQQVYIDSLAIDSNLKEVLTIFNYYTNEVITPRAAKLEAINNETANNGFESNKNLPPNNFVICVSKLVAAIPNLQNEEMLFLLLKFNKLFINLIKDEFFYKANRSLEDLCPELFVYITKQGINLTTFYKKALFSFFNNQILDTGILFTLLDFIVIEGFDFIHRLLVAVFKANESYIMTLDGNELNEFLNSSKFFDAMSRLEERVEISSVLKYEPEIIKYENEFHLLHANSLNNNNNELTNLKEVNDDLIIKINELRQQLENLKNTHSEILNQGDEHYKELQEKEKEKTELTALKDELVEKYEHLSMKENVKNTTKVNKEFATRNSDLEAQISAIKKKIEEKNAKLAKYSTK
mmetsp:Transcript_8428/g.10274  ORF Transcript_8428/g.10274 Transcript_8428/m.10274 type:complete len:525 (+) Transcript_8428:56-1630(+)